MNSEFNVGKSTTYQAIMRDLNIQDAFKEPVKEYVDWFIESWKNDIEEIAQLAICLNHNIWNLYKNNEKRAREYDAECKRINNLVYSDKYSKKQQAIFWRYTD